MASEHCSCGNAFRVHLQFPHQAVERGPEGGTIAIKQFKAEGMAPCCKWAEPKGILLLQNACGAVKAEF